MDSDKQLLRYFLFFFFFFLLMVPLQASESGHEFIRLFPDQRMLLQPGRTITTWISGEFEKFDDFKEVQPVIILEEDGKKDVVEVDVQGDKLRLRWKKIGTSQITLRIEKPGSGHIFYDRIKLEAWTPDYGLMFFSVLGGLGIFLLGMRQMSDGLQLVAGPSLRKLIATVTDNRFSAVLVGFGVTSIIQSSSVTTVMVVGFINSQIMTLSQGIGVIMGANIGTTITGWILTLNIGKYGLHIIGVAGLIYLFSKMERTRFLAMIFLGLGFVFFGLELMQYGFVPLRDLPEFSTWMESFSAETQLGVYFCIAIGCVLTLIVQSSSATLGITISLAAIGVIRFETAAALVLGENIGTTITAILASIGSSTNAKRAAYFHVLFNVLGVLWVSSIFRWLYLPLILSIVGVDSETGLIRDPKVGIALTHTVFNIVNTVVFLPFTGIAARFLMHYVRETDNETEKEQSRLTTLGIRRLETPAMAIERSRIEVIRMGNSCLRLLEKVALLIGAEEPDQKNIDRAFHQEEELDTLQDEIIEYTSSLLSGNISHDIGDAAHQQLRMADELESISDYLIVILKSYLKLRKDGLAIPEPQKSEFKELHHATEEYLSMIIRFYSARRTDFADLTTEVHAQGHSLTRKAKITRDLFIKRMSEEKFDPQIVIAFNTQFNAYRRVREHAQNVAEAIAGMK
ncbi:MAG: Na/Pi cotransporter family protein [Planctomycetaceae bacterium]|jgi:phosphate:Na+ symporter|nr:Na/Pi cotransporter family protein [Planctomycetaceae bacterium]